MRLAVLFPRILFLVPLAAALVGLVAQSSLLGLGPVAPFLFVAYAAAGILLALLPALLAPSSPLPATLAVIVPVLAVASYDQSRLDWLRLLKDYGVAAPGLPNALRLALGAAALLLAWGLHVVDGALRLKASAQARGFPEGEARGAAKVARRAGARLAGVALLGTAGVGLLAIGAAQLDAAALLGGRASLVAPLLAVALVALAAVLLWTDRARGEAE